MSEEERTDTATGVRTLPDDGYIIAWSGIAKAAAVKVGPWPDTHGWSDEFECTTGFCYHGHQGYTRVEKAQALLNLAAGIMFEGVPAEDVLREFHQIRTWREMSVLLPVGRMRRAFIAGSHDWNPHNP